MQIPHRSVVGVLTGVALGIGSTIAVQWVLEQRLARAIEPQVRTNASLTKPILLAGEPTLGSASAPLTIVEFSDFECSYCRRFHEKVFPKLKSQYIDTGMVRFVHKDLLYPFTPRPASSRSSTLCQRAEPLLGHVQRPI